jgi:pimeloyl-ACP methyl ester carboxylesterase
MPQPILGAARRRVSCETIHGRGAMRRPLFALFLALSVAAAACGDNNATVSTTAVAETGGTTTDTAQPYDVTFTTSDGLTLEGRVFPAGGIWVVLGHMRPADMTSWFAFAGQLKAAGYSALAYNNRNYGNSDRADVLDVGTDALAAVAFVRSQGAAQVFYFGASMNGAAALYVAAEEELAGIATLAAATEWDNTSGLSRAGEITEPGLYVAGEYDDDAAVRAQTIADAVAGAAEVIIYPTGEHGTLLFGPCPELADVLIAFVSENSS